MKVKFRDVGSGSVQARATIEIKEGVFLNEVTILEKRGKLIVEFPQKSFKGKDNRMHYFDIITFADEDKKEIWVLEIIDKYKQWRQENKKVLVYTP